MITPKFSTVKSNTSNVGEFISKLFEARTQTHIYHLQTTSYAQHVALGDFYDKVVDITDDIVEMYQGKYGIVKGYNSGKVDESNIPGSYITKLQEYIKSNRYTVFKEDDSEIQNTIDDLVSLVDSTIYKLKFLS